MTNRNIEYKMRNLVVSKYHTTQHGHNKQSRQGKGNWQLHTRYIHRGELISTRQHKNLLTIELK